MHIELKKAILNYMIEHIKNFNLVNQATKEFNQYIYTPKGQFCIGGKDVAAFISSAEKLIKL